MSEKLQDYKILEARLLGSNVTVFRLEDGTLLKVFVTLDQAGVAVDAENKPIRNPQGGFQYNFNFSNKVTVIPADKKYKAPAPTQPVSKPPEKTYG